MSVWAWARALWCQEECSQCQIASPSWQYSRFGQITNDEPSLLLPSPRTLTIWQSGIELSSVSGCRQVSGLSGMSRLSSWQQNLEQCVTLQSRVQRQVSGQHVTINCRHWRLTRAVSLQNLRLHKSSFTFTLLYAQLGASLYTYLTCLYCYVSCC